MVKKIKEIAGIAVAVVLALFFGLAMAVPIIVKLALVTALIDFLNKN